MNKLQKRDVSLQKLLNITYAKNQLGAKSCH